MHRCRHLLPLLALLSLLAGLAGCAPKQEVNCRELIADEKYAQVVKKCEDPFLVGTAYLALAGFTFVDFLQEEDPNNVVAVMDLTESNISVKREYLNQAIRTVAEPDTSSEAFVLLLGSFLGLSVTVEEYMDIGGGGDTALDDDITSDEMESATGMSFKTDATISFDVNSATNLTWAAVVDSAPYILDCGVEVGATYCDTPVTKSEDDSKGAAITAGAAATIDETTASDANVIALLSDFDLPIQFTGNKQERLDSFLNNLELDEDYVTANPDLFPIGILGYLDLLDVANAVLVGSVGGEEGDSTLNDSIDTLRATVDNGASCFDEAESGSELETTGLLLDNLYGVLYQSAGGTELNPITGTVPAGYYTDLNILDGDSITASGAAVTVIDPADTVFASVSSIGYKFFYPQDDSVTSFTTDTDLVTGRIDRTYNAFKTNFETIPDIAPILSDAEDGTITYAEVICLGY